MSLLTIDEEKVRQNLEHAPAPPFVVMGSSLAATPVDMQEGSSLIAGTLTVAAPPNNADAREYLLSLRHSIEESGSPLKTEEELDYEIDEMRRRNL